MQDSRKERNRRGKQVMKEAGNEATGVGSAAGGGRRRKGENLCYLESLHFAAVNGKASNGTEARSSIGKTREPFVSTAELDEMCSRPRSRLFILSLPRILLLAHFLFRKGAGGSYDTQGPTFVLEPPGKVEFISSSGGKADCTARGNPPPLVEWIGQDSTRISSVPSIRYVLTNGTLHFPPFEPDAFRQDVHWAIYRCIVTNMVGTVLSRDVVVRAVVNQRYEPEVQSPGGFLNNNVLFRCSVPSFVKDYVSVTSWLQQPAFNIYPSDRGDGKYHMLPTGELLVLNVTRMDALKTYRCRTHHRLTQEASVSRNEGKIQLRDMRGAVPPILNKKVNILSARAEDTLVVPCVAYANPRPLYRWFYRKDRQEVPLEKKEKFFIQDGILIISDLQRSDSGSYFCVASNREGSETLELQLTVTSPLSVHLHPPTQTAHLGKTAQLQCNLLGFPWNSVQWLKDGQPIMFGSRIRQASETSIQILSVEKDDQGMYQCIVKNDAETVQGSAEIRLGEIYPHLTYRFIEQTMQPGPSVSLKCSASGNPTPQIEWLLDGFPLIHSDRLLIGQYVSIFGDVVSHVNISSVKAEDGGEYECLVENRAGKVSHSARLNIYGLPFVRPMPPVSAVAGKMLLIKCPVAGYPIDSVTWEKEGARLPTTLSQRVSNNSLIIENIQQDSDQGTYSCSARNKQGHSSQRTVDVKVIVPPKITPFTFARDLKLGDRISVQCVVVSGDLPLTFVWLKDGSPPSESEALAMRRYDPFTSALTIGAIAPTHSGNYTCRASNEAGAATHTAMLRVNVPPRISPFYFEERVVTGMRTQVMCLASQGDRPFNITWSKDGLPISGLGIHISDFAPFSSILTIDNVAPSHSGNYTCTVSNAAGRAQYTADLSVTVPPFWVVEPAREQSVILGKSISLHCQADGFPKPIVTWKQATGKDVKSNDVQPGPEDYREMMYNSGNTVRMENGSLVIVKSKEEHKGYYMCEANNGVGAGKSKFIHLIVHAPPRFQFKTKQETARKGESAYIKCEAEGDLPMEFGWRTRGTEIASGYDKRYVLKNSSTSKGMLSELTIHEANQKDRGEYFCQASNVYGQDHAVVVLLVQEPPTPPEKVRVEVQSSRSVMLSWSPPASDGDTKVTNYVLQFKESRDVWHEHNSQKIVTGEQTMALVAGLKPATTYHFRIYAENELGTSSASGVISGTTETEAPTGAPKQVTAEPLSSTSVRVTWQPPDRNSWNGDLIGYNIGHRKLKADGDSYSWTYIKLPPGLPGDFRLTGLEKFTKYEVVVTANNAKGDGPPSEPVLVETMEDVPNDPPQDVQCMGLTPQAVQVTWRPPPAARSNGIIQGYKILYEPNEELSGFGTRETKVTNSGSIVLRGLEPYTNYSVKALAFTNAGEGVRSPPTYCITEESIPEAPSAVKAITHSEEAVIISWLPPNRTNGILTKYTVYIRVSERGTELKVIKSTLSPQHLHYEAVGLKKKEAYEAWVTASTKAGQGQSSAVVQLLPSSTVPAAIISFGRTIIVPWKSEVRLPCLHVGQPRPSIEWRLGDVRILKHSRKVVVEEKSLVIENVARNNEGNYSCHVRNTLGGDQITFPLVVQVPPTPPLLLATAVTSNSVQLQWKQGDSGGSAIRGFILSFRKDGREWMDKTIDPHMTSYLMEDLECGTSYQFRLTAFNRIGSGVASKLNSVVTKGERPVPPAKAAFISINSSRAVLHLGSWADGGCAVTRFSVSYGRSHGKKHQTLENLEPFRDHVLQDLSPGTEYVVTVTAYNSAGHTSQDYVFTTRADRRAPSPPYSATAEDENSNSSFYLDTQIVVLSAVSVLLSLVAVTTICFCFHRRPEREDICLRESQSAVTLDSKHSMDQREKYYTSVRKKSDSPCRDVSVMERIPEHAEDIYPYATFHLPEHESMEGNPRAQTYLYENQVKQKSDNYGKSRGVRGKIRRRSKTQKSDSEEYDSIGSDSDAERDLTLRAESMSHLCENLASRFPRGDSTLGRHRKKEDDPTSRYLPRPGVQSRSSHHSMAIHGDETYLQRRSPTSDRHTKKRSSKSRYLYESNIHNRLGMGMPPS